MTTIRLMDIAYHLPARVLTNEHLALEHPDWNLARVEQRTGVQSRHIAASGETALDLALTAARRLLDANPALGSRVDAILFCTQSPDYVMPPNATLLHGMLDLPETVLAIDFTLACSGYIYGLALAVGLASAGIAPRDPPGNWGHVFEVHQSDGSVGAGALRGRCSGELALGFA